MNNTIKLGLVGIETETAPAYTAADFTAALEQCDPTETLYLDIHSEGGSVFEGFGMATALDEWPGKIVGRVKVAAFSIASYIAMKCDEVEIAKNGFFMIHNPYTKVEGDDEALARDAKLLADMKAEMIDSYSKRTGLGPDEVQAIMKKESYFGAAKSIELGLADRIIETANAREQQLPKNHMPSFVFAAMYAGDAADVPPAETPKEKTVSEKPQTPVAASVKLIKARYPKASKDFIFSAMEEEMNMEEVEEQYAKSMEDENETLKAQVTAMEEELTALKAKAEEKPDEEKPAAKGLAPVAQAKGGVVPDANPRAQWDSAIESYVAKGKSRQQAVILANRNNPGLREQLLN